MLNFRDVHGNTHEFSSQPPPGEKNMGFSGVVESWRSKNPSSSRMKSDDWKINFGADDLHLISPVDCIFEPNWDHHYVNLFSFSAWVTMELLRSHLCTKSLPFLVNPEGLLLAASRSISKSKFNGKA